MLFDALFLDSKRSEERIVLTMLFFLFFFTPRTTLRVPSENAPIFNVSTVYSKSESDGVLSDGVSSARV